MKIFNTRKGILIEQGTSYYLTQHEWDDFINRDDLYDFAEKAIEDLTPLQNANSLISEELLPPVSSQEIWASGVTYFRSRSARMDESKDAGGGSFYDRVYNAKRPELFFKSSGKKAVGSGQSVRIRRDSRWNVPEPELTLMISANQKIIGYTIGNDMSSRDIEGENPLYLPQAKCYDKAAAIGPAIFVPRAPISKDSKIRLEIIRNGVTVIDRNTEINQIKRSFEELVHYLFLETTFPTGVLLMTGTGIIPPNEFTLDHGDEIKITIEPIGTLVNTVE